MLDQAAVRLVSPPAMAECPGPALDTDAGARVIPLDTRRRRLSSEVVQASRSCHPAQQWAESRRSRPTLVVATPS